MKPPLFSPFHHLLSLPCSSLPRAEHEIHVSHGTADKQNSGKSNGKSEAEWTSGVLPDIAQDITQVRYIEAYPGQDIVRRHGIEVGVLIGITLGIETQGRCLYHLNHTVADGSIRVPRWIEGDDIADLYLSRVNWFYPNHGTHRHRRLHATAVDYTQPRGKNGG